MRMEDEEPLKKILNRGTNVNFVFSLLLVLQLPNTSFGQTFSFTLPGLQTNDFTEFLSGDQDTGSASILFLCTFSCLPNTFPRVHALSQLIIPCPPPTRVFSHFTLIQSVCMNNHFTLLCHRQWAWRPKDTVPCCHLQLLEALILEISGKVRILHFTVEKNVRASQSEVALELMRRF